MYHIEEKIGLRAEYEITSSEDGNVITDDMLIDFARRLYEDGYIKCAVVWDETHKINKAQLNIRVVETKIPEHKENVSTSETPTPKKSWFKKLFKK